eukprot:TRINITY_DN6911_c0_g1_i2.p2 TRINITY_DN6911_c0_g1~~TRINITY_DN6911_c0_g1_i2.p2  ORF type:complete len:473 (+),score=112.61 TRINITY_DN6911_c0_g1_i2:2168-3586(+)
MQDVLSSTMSSLSLTSSQSEIFYKLMRRFLHPTGWRLVSLNLVPWQALTLPSAGSTKAVRPFQTGSCRSDELEIRCDALHFLDRYAVRQQRPRLDAQSNICGLSFTRNSTATRMIVQRSLLSCDSSTEDNNITTTATRLIVAQGVMGKYRPQQHSTMQRARSEPITLLTAAQLAAVRMRCHIADPCLAFAQSATSTTSTAATSASTAADTTPSSAGSTTQAGLQTASTMMTAETKPTQSVSSVASSSALATDAETTITNSTSRTTTTTTTPAAAVTPSPVVLVTTYRLPDMSMPQFDVVRERVRLAVVGSTNAPLEQVRFTRIASAQQDLLLTTAVGGVAPEEQANVNTALQSSSLLLSLRDAARLASLPSVETAPEVRGQLDPEQQTADDEDSEVDYVLIGIIAATVVVCLIVFVLSRALVRHCKHKAEKGAYKVDDDNEDNVMLTDLSMGPGTSYDLTSGRAIELNHMDC